MVGPLLTLGLMLRDLRNDFNAQTLQTQLRTSQLQSDLAAFIMNNTEMMATATKTTLQSGTVGWTATVTASFVFPPPQTAAYEIEQTVAGGFTITALVIQPPPSFMLAPSGLPEVFFAAASITPPLAPYRVNGNYYPITAAIRDSLNIPCYDGNTCDIYGSLGQGVTENYIFLNDNQFSFTVTSAGSLLGATITFEPITIYLSVVAYPTTMAPCPTAMSAMRHAPDMSSATVSTNDGGPSSSSPSLGASW